MKASSYRPMMEDSLRELIEEAERAGECVSVHPSVLRDLLEDRRSLLADMYNTVLGRHDVNLSRPWWVYRHGVKEIPLTPEGEQP